MYSVVMYSLICAIRLHRYLIISFWTISWFTFKRIIILAIDLTHRWVMVIRLVHCQALTNVSSKVTGTTLESTSTSVIPCMSI